MQTALTSTPTDLPNPGPKPPTVPSSATDKQPAVLSSATEKTTRVQERTTVGPGERPSSTRELVRLLLATQQASLSQSLADREAAAASVSRTPTE
ncbi:hypothetical protein PGT21_000135 [Puccinia graminis f. sp. tritici]|uniref:Uncharacterized protein n=1 Tax=Puccinia graminis f. sp. tritici TaxID=56615 RepID=A0A5B0LKA1_PUCGR|nr:hypothetical protein PGT21_000135 [Puccinia graminis f. sp. tritici]